MPRSKQTDKARRAPRVKLAGTILALLRLDNGRESAPACTSFPSLEACCTWKSRWMKALKSM